MICVANHDDFVPHGEPASQSDLRYGPFFSRLMLKVCFIGFDWQPDLWYSKVIIIYKVLLDKFKVRSQD